MLPLLVVVPHSSGYVPIEVLADMLGDARFDSARRADVLQHLFSDGDPYTDLLFHIPEAHVLTSSISRFVVDVNRYRGDASANGIIKLTDFNEVPLYPKGFQLSQHDKEQRLRRYYDSFHGELKHLLREHNINLLINGHSMTPFGPRLGPDQGKPRPALTIMTGGDAHGEAVAGQRLSLEPEDARALKTLAEQHFAPLLKTFPGTPVVALNDPWDVDEISDIYASTTSLPCFGLEVNQALYLDHNRQLLPKQLKTLNTAFANFARAAVDLVSLKQQVTTPTSTEVHP